MEAVWWYYSTKELSTAAPAAAWFRRFESDEPGSPRAAAAHGSATATLQAHLIASGWVDFLERAHLFKV